MKDLSFSDWLGILGLFTTVVGFGLTIWQLIRTANASVATKAAIEATARRMSLNHLLVLIPQLRVIEGDLDAAMAEDDRKLAIRTLVNYSHTANQVASLLEGEDGEVDGELIDRLRGSAAEAGKAKSVLVTSTRGTVKTVAKAASEGIGEVAGHAAGLVAQFQVKAS
jgi:hypothetical protein